MVDVLAIAAHPDDVEQTCGGTLMRMQEQGYRTGVLDLTAGEMGTRGTPEQRLQEAEAAAKVMRLAWRGNMKFPDAQLEDSITYRTALAVKIRELRPRVVVVPYWEARHPDHVYAGKLASEACFFAGLRKLDAATEPHRPYKVVYSSLYSHVVPSFVVDISAWFERRMESLFCYASQYAEVTEGGALFPSRAEIVERHAAMARFYGNLIGVRYGEPFVSKEVMRVDDLAALPVRSF